MPAHVTFDRDCICHVDGEPFFLIGARHMPDGGTPAMLADAGFNAYRRLAFGHEISTPEPLPEADEGLYFWGYIYDRAALDHCPGYRRELEDYVRAVRNHPALLCYENLNEPAMFFQDRPLKAEPDELREGTQLLRELDPDHPIWLAHSCHRTVEFLAGYNHAADAIGCNPYPVAPRGIRQHLGFLPDGRILDCPDQSIHTVGRYTEKMMRVGGGTMPVWMLIQALANENWYSPKHTPELAGQGIDEAMILYPTFEQMRFMAYDAILAGATGLAFSMARTPVESPTWTDVKRLVCELRNLTDALTAPPADRPVEMAYTDLGFTIWDGVRVMARQRGDRLFLFAANTACDPAAVQMRMPRLTADTCAVVENEDREVPVEKGVLSDRFEPFAVHIYRLTIPG